jgi:hypothetical protein
MTIKNILIFSTLNNKLLENIFNINELKRKNNKFFLSIFVVNNFSFYKIVFNKKKL